RGSSAAAVAKVPCTGLPSASRPPVERGKNSYQEPKSARVRSTSTWWAGPRVTSSRSGWLRRISAISAEKAGATRAGSWSSPRSAVAAARSFSNSALRTVWASRSNSLAPISRPLARSAALWPTASLASTAWRQVAIGSLRPSTRTVHRPGVCGTKTASKTSGSAAGVILVREGRFAPGARTAMLAATASCPSRHTTARTGNTSPTTALAGRPPGIKGAVSSMAMRPVTCTNLLDDPRPRRVWPFGPLSCVNGRFHDRRGPAGPCRVLPVKALRRFTVRAHLPERLAALGELSTNLRWSWHPPTQDVFAAIDPQLWRAVDHDPVRMLGEVPAARLDELATDPGYLAQVDAAAADLRDYLAAATWFQRQGREDAVCGIAYFSMEFGVTEVLPNYSGGLGILAGDHLKAASDLGLPLIGVGLLYRSGYFRQSLSADGWQIEHYPALDPQGLPLRLLTSEGSAVLVHVAMPDGRVLRARVWIAQVGRVPLLLPDSDIAEDDADLRAVTDRLYGGDQDHRIKQEILAGIGGVRAVRAYTRAEGLPDPEVFHMNEGHAGFLGVERIREYVATGMDFDTALTVVRASTVFTTHTPVPAGIDRFPMPMVRRYFGGAHGEAESALLPGLSVDRILALGREADPSVYNMAHMGLRLAQRANGVSRLHGEVSRGMFAALSPGFDPQEVPIGSVTNGVHAPTWAAREWVDKARELVGPELVEEGRGWEKLREVDLGELWSTRNTLRATLVAEVRRRLRISWLERGAAEAELGWIDEVFDPDVLTVGFARRVPTYKRLTLMLRDPERLRGLLLDPDRPMQLVVAGKSHPADDGGKALIQQVVRFADDPELRHRIVFLPDYDM